eukprot:Em0008g150a
MRSNIGAIRSQVDDVKEATRQNIGKVVARGEKLDDLQAKAQGLEFEANSFRKGARAVHRKEGCSYCKWCFILMCILMFLFIVVAGGVAIGVVCGKGKC